jgi:LysM repeat protein
MRKIFISAGHSNKTGRDRGAAGNGYVEGVLAVNFRNKVVANLKKLAANVTIDGDDSILQDTLNFFRKQVNDDAIVLDIHFNAAGPTATGTETLVPANFSLNERKLANLLSNAVAETLDIPLRGDKGVKTELESHHKKLGWMSLKGENVLMELCFISNAKDMSSFIANEDILAQKVAEILYNFSKNIIPNEPLKNYQSVVYTVRSGDTLGRIAQMFKTDVTTIQKKNNLTSDLIHVGQQLKM